MKIPKPVNEPVFSYSPGSPERKDLKSRLSEMRASLVDIPLTIGGREVRTGNLSDCRCPHEHGHVLGRYHRGGALETQQAIDAALKARKEWASMPWQARAAIFLKAADLLAGPWRSTLNAASMLCQSKNAFQAEIDSACELIDFFRFNVYFAEKIYEQQPLSSPGTWNTMEYRSLEGFIFAVTPFNFTSIAGNLPSAPAILGNTVVWKPAAVTVYTAHFLMKLWKAAGLPEGVINLVTGPAGEIASACAGHRDLAGIHFTGSTSVFQNLWSTVGANIQNYRTYPRLVGETGGKDFVFLHSSADVPAAAAALMRGAFEYQGQKCSAASRAYVPDSLWPELKKSLQEQLQSVKMGPPEDFRNFVNAVIDKSAFQNIKGYIDHAKASKDAEVIFGGKCDDSSGYFIEPTVIYAKDPFYKTMQEEIFGPVLTIYVYPEKEYEQTLLLCDRTSPYSLTGAIFADDRKAILKASEILIHAAGNFYINDKPTGAVVAQQPFGGARASGTNDKAGSTLNLLRWVSARAIKENFTPSKDYRYHFMAEE